MRQARRRKLGERSSLTPSQEAETRRLICGKAPDPLKMAFAR
ncbi:MAG: hypothetical protein AB1830_17585 [Pseudomonadota bacterium]